MNALALLTIGFAPGAFWLWLIYQRDRYLPAPPSLVLRTFLWGVVIAVPVSLIEAGLTGFNAGAFDEPATHLSAAYVAFVVAGGTEEIAKYLAVRLTVSRSPYFSQPKDGMIYAAAVALGFASIENVGYMFTFGPGVILVRGPFSTLAHVVFGGLWGYALGRERLKGRGRWLSRLALVAGVALHGLFDFLVFTERPWGAIALFLVGLLFFALLLRGAVRASGKQRRVVGVVASCPACGSPAETWSRVCGSCRKYLHVGEQRAHAQCGGCGAAVGPHYRFCSACGGRLGWNARRKDRVVRMGSRRG